MGFLKRIFQKKNIPNRPNYGVFDDFWNNRPNHLPFLKLRYSEENFLKCDLSNSLNQLDKIFKTNNDIGLIDGIKLLLKDENWRSDLVACMAILKLSKPNQDIFKIDLWELLSTKFSMVSPQILVVLSLIDRDFNTKAKTIIQNGFVIKYYDSYTNK